MSGQPAEDPNDAADHWDALAEAEDRMVAWDVAMGICPFAEMHPGVTRARTYRDTARALRLEALTGVPHCVCHLKPRTKTSEESFRRVDPSSRHSAVC